MTDHLPAYEKLGAFYLGRPLDPATAEPADEPLLYDSQDLLTHAVCVGMTGSGKTGLCVGLLEEAAIDGVPALIIDPKGDLGNLLLTFPDLAPGDFEPWVDAGEAARKGLSVGEYAAQQADLWRGGLAKWGQSGERIRRLKEAADFAIYTPGSLSGLPISLLDSLAPPRREVLDDPDLLADRTSTLVTTLLGLLGIDADPVRSREHILISAILNAEWAKGASLDLAGLIHAIQSPPFSKLGVMEVDSFFPAQDRFELSIAFNNLMASPAMQKWLTGPPLDIDRLLYTDSGKPRVAILSVAHLSEKERMSFVALVLNEVVGWIRTRSGTTSLRAVLYMDEVFGYLPPVAEPPSKRPLLTLLKQARAFGLGVVLATQNPADLDYKALSNAGTWFLGRLQTERDKLRVLEGLKGVSAEAGGAFDPAELERIITGLGKRTFLLHNVHEEQPVVFRTRWALSYLRGPLDREQIRRLMEPRRQELEASAPGAGGVRAAAATEVAGANRPLLPPEIEESFFVVRGRTPDELVYRPGLLGTATVHFVDNRRGVDQSEPVALYLRLAGGTVDWYDAEELDRDRFDPERSLERRPEEGASFGELPDAAVDPRSYRDWEKDLADRLYRERRLELWTSPTYKQTSRPGESERDFRIRLADEARERRDAEKERLRERYESKLARLGERLRKAEQRVEREKDQAQGKTWDTLATIGGGLLSGLLGGRRRSIGSQATSALRGVQRRLKEGQDVDRAEEDVAAVRAQIAEVEAELAEEIEELGERFDPQAEELEVKVIKPRRTDVKIHRCQLAWAPFGSEGGEPRPLWDV